LPGEAVTEGLLELALRLGLPLASLDQRLRRAPGLR